MSQRLFVATATATGAADAPDECVCALFFSIYFIPYRYLLINQFQNAITAGNK